MASLPAPVLNKLDVLGMFTCLRALRAHVLRVLACSMNMAWLRAWRATLNSVLDVLGVLKIGEIFS